MAFFWKKEKGKEDIVMTVPGGKLKIPTNTEAHKQRGALGASVHCPLAQVLPTLRDGR